MKETKPHFKLKKKTDSEEETSIRLYVFHSNFPHRRFVYGLKKSILPALWDDATQRPTNNKKLIKEYEKHIPTIANDLRNITADLNKVYSAVDDYFTMAKITTNRITVTSESLKDYLDGIYKPKPKEVTIKKKETLNTYIERFIKEHTDGKRLIEKRGGDYVRMEAGSIKNYRSFQTQFNEYQKANGNVNFEDVTEDFYKDFIRFFHGKKYRTNTIGRHIARLKTIMQAALNEKLHSTKDFLQKSFRSIKHETDQVYLNEAELNAIRNVDLSEKPHLELYRDIFLIGCYTAQRVSDYNNIQKHNIVKLENGKKAIKLHQKKTKEDVIIPIKKELDAILKKYNYSPPRVHDQNLNDEIKKVCELAGITDDVEINETIGGEVKKTLYPKFKLVSSHTARRSGASNMFNAGIPTLAIQKITGHKTEASFLSYIRITKEENATSLSTHKYFM